MTQPLVETLGRRLTLDGEAVFAGFCDATAVFATGEAEIFFAAADGAEAKVSDLHHGALLSACASPTGGVLTGGDDGRIVSTAPGRDPVLLAHDSGGWIDALDASRVSGAIVAAIGKDVLLVKPGEGVTHRFAHEQRVAGVALEPNGRRLAAAHYGGVTISWASNPASRRKTLEWKGAHLFPLWSGDARHLVTAMQENALHGWRLQDGSHFRMSGYPTKIRSMSFSAAGRWLATAGAPEVICWPFDGPSGPVNREGAALGGFDAPVTCVACHPARPIVAAGAANGEVALIAIGDGPPPVLVETPAGAPVTALAWGVGGKAFAFADASGRAGVLDLSPLEA